LARDPQVRDQVAVTLDLGLGHLDWPQMQDDAGGAAVRGDLLEPLAQLVLADPGAPAKQPAPPGPWCRRQLRIGLLDEEQHPPWCAPEAAEGTSGLPQDPPDRVE